jgi:hypothetical protein
VLKRKFFPPLSKHSLSSSRHLSQATLFLSYSPVPASVLVRFHSGPLPVLQELSITYGPDRHSIRETILLDIPTPLPALRRPDVGGLTVTLRRWTCVAFGISCKLNTLMTALVGLPLVDLNYSDRPALWKSIQPLASISSFETTSKIQRKTHGPGNAINCFNIVQL